MSKSKYQHFYAENEQNKGASLGFDEIKNKKVASSVFGEIKKNPACLPHLFFKKVAGETLVYFFSLSLANLIALGVVTSSLTSTP